MTDWVMFTCKYVSVFSYATYLSFHPLLPWSLSLWPRSNATFWFLHILSDLVVIIASEVNVFCCIYVCFILCYFGILCYCYFVLLFLGTVSIVAPWQKCCMLYCPHLFRPHWNVCVYTSLRNGQPFRWICLLSLVGWCLISPLLGIPVLWLEQSLHVLWSLWSGIPSWLLMFCSFCHDGQIHVLLLFHAFRVPVFMLHHYSWSYRRKRNIFTSVYILIYIWHPFYKGSMPHNTGVPLKFDSRPLVGLLNSSIARLGIPVLICWPYLQQAISMFVLVS